MDRAVNVVLPAAYPVPDTLWDVESPRDGDQLNGADHVRLRGWIATTSLEVDASLVVGDGPAVALALVPRPDVTAIFGLPAQGWDHELARDALPATARQARLDLRLGGTVIPITIDLDGDYGDESARRSDKRERIRRVLRCPQCGGARFTEGVRYTRCRGCRTVIGRRGKLPFDFLGKRPDVRADAGASTNISANEYDPFAVDLLRRNPDALVLDCGAGSRSVYFHNVVNLEIARYPSTDVLATGDDVPFQDESFDGVFSFAVLEHVRDPFRCARELLRVLKPGGFVYAQVPFLQPVHAYPDHYYNMTLNGLEQLFTSLDLVQTGVFPFGQPVFLLSWFLNRYADGLPAAERARFLDQKVADLLAPGHSYLGAPLVTELAPATRADLACANFVLGRKKA